MADHLALPLRVNPTGRLGAVRQDSPAEVAQSVALVLSTRAGERLSVPTYGAPVALFGPTLNVSGLEAAIDTWEPRAGEFSLSIDAASPGEPVVSVYLGAAAGGTVVTVAEVI